MWLALSTTLELVELPEFTLITASQVPYLSKEITAAHILCMHV